ncbi:hypothetical protein P4I20_18890, partial [Paenibacillus graminis]
MLGNLHSTAKVTVREALGTVSECALKVSWLRHLPGESTDVGSRKLRNNGISAVVAELFCCGGANNGISA